MSHYGYVITSINGATTCYWTYQLIMLELQLICISKRGPCYSSSVSVIRVPGVKRLTIAVVNVQDGLGSSVWRNIPFVVIPGGLTCYSAANHAADARWQWHRGEATTRWQRQSVLHLCHNDKWSHACLIHVRLSGKHKIMQTNAYVHVFVKAMGHCLFWVSYCLELPSIASYCFVWVSEIFTIISK